MIQRVQSLFLLAISLLMIIFLFVPIWEKVTGSSNPEAPVRKAELGAFKVAQINSVSTPTSVETIIVEKSTWYIGALAITCAAIAFFSIFQYNNRMLQLKLGLLNTLLIAGIVALIFFLGVKEGNQIMPENGTENYKFGFFIPAIALLCNSLANRFIRKDEDLVRSSDRIR